jgi:RNA polymerase sigma-32 factor
MMMGKPMSGVKPQPVPALWPAGAVLAPAGSLDAYIRAVNRFPILDADEEQRLARSFREKGDLDAARRLVLSYLRLVVATARGYLGYGLPYADLIQEGNIGLMRSLNRFDPGRGVRLASFALHWIRASIHEYIVRNWRLVKLATTKAQRKLFFNLRSMKQSAGPMTAKDVRRVARELRVTPEQVVEMETRLAGHDLPLEVDDGGDKRFASVHYLAADCDAEPLTQLEAKDTERARSAGMQKALKALDPRSRRIIEARWLHETNRATLHELAAALKISAERVRQVEAKALQRMRKAMEQVADEDARSRVPLPVRAP